MKVTGLFMNRSVTRKGVKSAKSQLKKTNYGGHGYSSDSEDEGKDFTHIKTTSNNSDVEVTDDDTADWVVTENRSGKFTNPHSRGGKSTTTHSEGGRYVFSFCNGCSSFTLCYNLSIK